MINLRRLGHWLQFDKSLSFALLARIWQVISGPVTVVLQYYAFSLAELGIYLTILSVVAVQPLFELGLASVLIGQAGNLIGKASPVSRENGDSSAQLAWLARGAMRWFTAIAVLYAVGGMCLGWKVLAGSETTTVDWRWPLVWAVLSAALSLAVSPRIYVLEGAGEREYVYRMRFWQAVCGSLTMWLALLLGWKLWAIVAVFGVAATFHLLIAFGHRARHLLTSTSSLLTIPRNSWLARIGPLQWRMAALSAAHYLASQLLFLYVSYYHNEVIAAPLGQTLQVTAAIQALALAWAQTKFPLIARYQAEERRELAGTLWRQTALVSSGLLLLAMVALAVAVAGLAIFQRGWELRFIPPWQVLLLGVGYLANHVLALQSFYVLSRGARPLVLAAGTGLLCTALAVWLGGKYFSVLGVITAYSISMTCLTLPLHSWAYLRFRQRKTLV